MTKAILEQPIVLERGITYHESSYLNIFWTGYLLYTLSFTFGTTETVALSVVELFQVIGMLLFIPAAMALISFRLESNYLKVMYTLYCCWLLIVIARGFTLDYTSIKRALFDPHNGVFLYFVPLMLLLPAQLAHYKKIFTTIVVIGLFFILYDIIFIKRLTLLGDETSRDTLDYFSKTLGLPSGFLLLTYVYHSQKKVFIAGCATVLMLLLLVYGARRGLTFLTVMSLLFTFIIYSLENRKRLVNVVISVVAGLLVGLYAGNMFYQNDAKFFGFAKERLDEDSRSGVELYFFDDMKPQDWWIGRGMNGLVAAPVSLYDDHVPGKPGYRDGIETDYLKIILKGGILSLGLQLLIAVPAVFLGLFSSKNLFSKAAAFWIILWLLALYPSNVTNFSFNYILVWVSIGICYSKSIRNMPESYLRQMLH
jgi:hypothetical protein